MDFNFMLVVESMPYLLKGALITISISLLAIILGVLIGFIIAFFRLSGNMLLDLFARIFVNLIRGIPFFIQIFIVYYSLTSIGIELSAFVSGMLAMAINTAAFQAEIYRSGIESIARGQKEAAFALGISKTQTMRRLVIPQVFTKVLPSLTNEFIILLKNSSLVSVIGVVELTRVGGQIVSTTYSPAEIYITVAILYFLINMFISQLSRYMERRAVMYH